MVKRKQSRRPEMILWSLVGTVVLGTAGGGWYANEYIHDKLASKESVQVAGAKADFALDKQMEATIAQINRIEGKKNKTREDLNQLDYLRQQLEIMRQIRRGK